MLYDGSVIAKETNVISTGDSEETMMLVEESRSKMLLKQSDPMVLEKKVNTKPINYVELNRLSEDFGKRFVPHRELSDEQALHPNTNQSASSPVKIEAPRELPKKENGDQIISQDIVNIVVNSSLDINTSMNVNYFVAMNDSVNYVEMCNKCLELEAELIKQHNMVEKDEYNKLLKRFSKLEQHCISLEIAMQLNKEIFQKNNTSVNQTEPSFDQLFNLNNLKAELQAKDTTIKKLKANIKHLNKTSTTNSVKKDIDEIETINIELEHRAKEHAESLVNQSNQKSIEITNLNAQLQEKVFVITTLKNDLRKFKGKDIVDNVAQASNATTIAPGMYKLDPLTLAPKDKNNRETHKYYLKHTMKQAAILREIVEQSKSLNPLDSASYSVCKYVKLIQELLGYVRETCLDIHKPSEKLVAVTPINKKKTVRFDELVISSSTSQKQLGSSQTKTKQTTNNFVSTSTGVGRSTKSSRSKSTDNKKNDRTQQISSRTQKKNKVEDHSRIVKSSLNKKNCVVEPSGNANVEHSNFITNSELMCVKCNSSMFNARRELCFLEFVSDINARRTFTLVGNACPLTRITANNKVPIREPIPLEVVQIVLWYLDSECSKYMTRDHSQLTNFVHKFLDTVKFGNDQIAKIMGYGDYQIRNIIISRVYYVEGLGHNLFSVGQFCNSDLEVAFRKHMCFVHNLKGVDLLSGSQETNLYTFSIGDMMASSPICLLHGLVRGLPKLKFEKDHLCSACAMGKSKKQSHKPKSEDTNQEKLYLLHMDLCEPMRVASINRKKYILVIVDDYSRFTWVTFLASKDEAPDFIIKFMKMIQVRLNATVKNIRTDNGTEFVNQTLKPDLSYLYVFGALCYPNNDNENLGKLQAKDDIGIFIGYASKKKAYHIYNRRTRKIIKIIHVDFDELTAMASEQLGSGPELQCMTPATSSSGLVPNPIPQQPCIPPLRDDWDRLFQPMFDEYFNPPIIIVSLVPVADAPRAVDLADSLVFTSIDQDAPSTSIPSSKEQVHSPIISQGMCAGSGYHQKDRKPSQNDKTEHGMEKTVQNQGQSPKMPKSESIQKNQQSNRSRN
ncbi:retrovirus-related pol polyprotein from transposon TNT 1-94 [Tanacetum coccineum]